MSKWGKQWNRPIGYPDGDPFMFLSNPKPGSKPGSKEPSKKLVLFRLFPYCCWCEKELNIQNATIEHLLPRNRGGSNNIDNLAIACEECNNKRSSSLRSPTGKVAKEIAGKLYIATGVLYDENGKCTRNGRTFPIIKARRTS